MRISLCMIVKNEEKNIINCLNRAMDLVDEAIIVDTGSTDKTKELILEKYRMDSRVKLIDYVWENDFSKARNESIKYAKGDWILVLDADERIFFDKNRLTKLLDATDKQAFIIPVYNVIDRENIYITSSMVRLYRNINPRYEGAIHEQILLNNKLALPDIIDAEICRIYHYGYAETVFKEKDKQSRNMEIIKSEIEKDPENPFNWYNKGVMEMIQGNYDVAIDDFLKSHKLTYGVRTTFHNDLVVRVAQCMIMEGQYDKAIEFIDAVSSDPFVNKIPDIYYYGGIACIKLEKYNLAINYFQKAIDTGEYKKGMSNLGAGSFLPKIEWAKVLLLTNKKKLAIEKLKEAVFDENNVNRQGLDMLIELLKQENLVEELEELKNDISRSSSTIIHNNEELEIYKTEIKENIEKLVESGMLEESKKLIEEYEKIVKDDIDIFSIKGVIAMIEGNIEEAEELLNIGLLKDSNNKDLLFNIAYLYETIGRINKAIYFYKKLYHLTESIYEKKAIKENLEKLGGNVTYRVLIGSPVHQKPQILKEFLQSLKELDKEDLIVDFYFVDDNNNNESSNILKKFAIEEKNVFITKSFFNDEYICDNNTHHWKEHLVWKVARFKDNIIKHAKCNNYDYLFLIDSDLVLHPNTLKHLLSTGKDIISEIFWTKWTIDSPELPQVWLSDFYTQYEIARGESLSKTEMLARHQKFINMLKKPGIYEVGGLGACTLISKYALDRGVSFSEIKNLSFWGEDRHFCIRATALGFSLYVDTHYPAYHIYRESDLEGVSRYKELNISGINKIKTVSKDPE